jgi:type VI secretion system protein ImpH
MGAEIRDTRSAVNEHLERAEAAGAFARFRAMLEEEPFRFQFFQAVRVLQKLERGRKPVGYFITPRDEAIRFTARPSLAFPPSELHELKRGEDGQLEMTVEFMGLCASISPLPAVYTEHLLERIREKDYATRDFFNIFNHRMISFFYRGWEKYRFFVEFERDGHDQLSERVLDLEGLGTEGLRSRSGILDQVFLYYAGNLARHVRSAAALERILAEYFEIPVKIEQFAGTWRSLVPENQTRFTGEGGVSEQLGAGVVAGDEVWDHHGRIRVWLGPMTLAQYLEFLPGKDAHRELEAWMRFFSNGHYEAEVKLVMRREDVPKCTLGAGGEIQPQLGLVSWLMTRPMDRDPADATYLIATYLSSRKTGNHSTTAKI